MNKSSSLKPRLIKKGSLSQEKKEPTLTRPLLPKEILAQWLKDRAENEKPKGRAGFSQLFGEVRV